DVLAEQHHQMIAFGKDHQAWWRSNPADNVRYGISVTGDRPNARLQLGHNWPDKRLRRLCSCLLFCGARHFCLRETYHCQSSAKKYAAIHHGESSSMSRLVCLCGELLSEPP